MFHIPFKNILFFTVLLLSFASTVYAQKKKLDSLYKVYYSDVVDTTKILALLDIAYYQVETLPDTTLLISEKTLAGSLTINFIKGIERSYYNMGYAYYKKSDYQKALTYYPKAITILKQTNNQAVLSRRLNDVGLVYLATGDYPKALDCYFQSIQIKEVIGDKRGTAIGYNNIALIYRRQENYDLALAYHEKSLKIGQEIKDAYVTAGTFNNIGLIYKAKGEKELALTYYQKALEIREQTKNKRGISSAQNNIADMYREMGQYTLSLKYYQKNLEILNTIDEKKVLIENYNGLAKTYLALKNYPQALDYAQKGLTIAQQIKALEELNLCAETLYKIYKIQGDYRNAIQYHELYKQTSDSLFNVEKSKTIANLEARTEIAQKKQEIDFLNEKQAILQKEKQLQTRLNYGISLGMIIVLILSFFIYRAKQQALYAKKEIEKQNNEINQQKEEIIIQKEALEHQTHELEKVNYTKDKLFAIIGHDLRSPIANLQGIFTLVAMGHLNQQEFETISASLLNSINYTVFTLDNLLNWANSQMRGMEAMPTSVKLTDLANENFNFLQTIAQDKKISLNNYIPEDAYVYADSNQISLIFRNLISNALKFTMQGGSINISAVKEGNFWKVAIQDTGVGIPTDKISLIFKNNQSFTTYGTNNEKGTGLGLILCQEMVEKNNGQIGVESQVGLGTTFWFKLPSN
jgi:signal transduction histidine kinase